MKRFKFNIFTAVITLLLVVSSCSSKKNTTINRGYHHLTAYYNYYYNAYDSYKNSMRRVNATYRYNYTSPLPVLLIGDSQVTGIVGGDMDRAIKKSTDLISKHSITVKPERKRGLYTSKDKDFYNQTEFVKWAREAWLLIGLAQTWKGSLDEATQTLEFILLQYPNTTIWYEAQIWLARISILQNDFINAEDKLKTVESNKKKPRTKTFKHLLYSTWAYYYSRQSKYSEVINPLKKAIQNSTSRADRIRYYYLLAQLSQQLGKNKDATSYYKKVLRMNPSYEMAFNAQIGIASTAKDGEGNRDMRKLLLKLAKDEKNKDYLDQIYYTLGSIEKTEGNIEKAIEYYKLSASKSTGNVYQKGLSYLTLADYYFDKPNYPQSQAYYDSAYNALDPTFPDYQKLETKTHFLNKLVENLNTVEREDSLQRVAKMSPSERDKLITEIISKIEAEEQKIKAEELEDRQRYIQYQQNQRYQQTQEQTGKWYFYNQAQLSFGQSEFQMKWGKRKLEDNWRRKNKRISSIDFGQTSQQQAVSDTSKTPQKIVSKKSKEYYMQDIPTNDSLLKLSNLRIMEAMFKVGEVYQNDLKDYNETVLAYEKFTKRFPESDYTLQAYYNLYQVSLFTNNSANSEKYKDIIISRFPKSNYAIMLTNPNYLKELIEKQKQEDAYYQEVYDSYLKGEYSKVILKVDQGLERFRGSKNEPQFELLKSLCVGKVSDLRTFRTSLNDLVEKYPNTEVSETASGILEYLRKQELQLATSQVVDTAVVDTLKESIKPTIVYNQPQGEHLFVVLVPKKSNLNQLKFNLVSFNVDAFIEIDLAVNNESFNDFFEIIKVERFKDSKKAMEYYQAAKVKEGLFNPLKKDEYTMFVISSDNYAIFLGDKNLADYLIFFNTNYK